MTSESNILQECRLAASECGARVFRNNRGLFYTVDSVKTLISAILSGNIKRAIEIIKNNYLRLVRAGLEANGSCDLIGIKPVTITPDMVGNVLGVFVGLECKTDKGKTSADQLNFIEQINKLGGITGVTRGKSDVYALLK